MASIFWSTREPENHKVKTDFLKWQPGFPTLKHIAVSWNYFNLRVKDNELRLLSDSAQKFLWIFQAGAVNTE